MNRGIVEQHPARESFVVERFSAVVALFRHARKSALKRSTTNLRRFRVPMRAKKEWRLPMNLPHRPLTCVLFLAAGERQGEGESVIVGHECPRSFWPQDSASGSAHLDTATVRKRMGVVALAVPSQLSASLGRDFAKGEGAASPSAGDSRRYNGGSVKCTRCHWQQQRGGVHFFQRVQHFLERLYDAIP